MKTKKPQKIPNSEAKDGNIQKLKARNKKLERENARLKSELRAYESAFTNTKKFLKDHTNDISLEDLIQAAKSDKSLRDVEQEKAKKSCPKCQSTVKELPSPAGKITVCGNPMCDYRSVEK